MIRRNFYFLLNFKKKNDLSYSKFPPKHNIEDYYGLFSTGASGGLFCGS